jgi:hypothetical protein
VSLTGIDNTDQKTRSVSAQVDINVTLLNGRFLDPVDKLSVDEETCVYGRRSLVDGGVPMVCESRRHYSWKLH